MKLEIELTFEDIFGKWYLADFIYKYIQQKEEEKKTQFSFFNFIKVQS